MKGGLKIVGILSLALLICVLIGQLVWVFKLREVKVEEFRYTTTFALTKTIDQFLDEEYVFNIGGFSCGLLADGKTFKWGKKVITMSSPNMYREMTRLVFYDYLYRNNSLHLGRIDSLYRQCLHEKGIYEFPVLMLWDDSTRETLMVTDTLQSFQGQLFTRPVNIGYECKHQLVAAFREPLIFRSMIWHLVWEGVFLIGFIWCLIWQWKMMRMTWRSARVQTMGVAHLEHELKKPLAAMISAVSGIANRKNKELTEVQEFKLRIVMASLRKMADVTDTMLAALKTSDLELERAPVDIRKEMELTLEMFRILRPHAKVDIQIDKGIERPVLDVVYFNCLVINLIDNGIKYGGDDPEVSVVFGKVGTNWMLTVTDNGIGMPAKVLKRIFRQFYRVKDKRVTEKTGFGLGLAFVKKVVDVYGGEIRVESQPGVGSRFIILLPENI